MSRSAITEPYWQALCKPVQDGHHFGPLQETIVAISNLPARFPALFSNSKADLGKITAAEVFTAMANLANAIHRIHPEFEKYYLYFVTLNEIWPAGLASDRFKILQDNKAVLEHLSIEHFGSANEHPTVTSPATYGYLLLRAFFNHMLIDGNFNAFAEMQAKWAVTRNFFFKNFKTDANTAKAIAALRGCQTACAGFVASLAAASESKSADREMRPRADAMTESTFDARAAEETKDRRPAASATAAGASSVTTLTLFSASTGTRSDPKAVAELYCVFRARSMIDAVHHYLQQREEEIDSATTGYSREDYQQRADSFTKIKAEIQQSHITDLHNTLIALFIESQAKHFSGWIPKISRTQYATNLQPIINSLKDTSANGLCVRHFQAALRQIQEETQAATRSAFTTTPSAP